MISCNDMKVKDVFGCSICGVKLEVVSECNCSTNDNCKPIANDACCDIQCCGQAMAKN